MKEDKYAEMDPVYSQIVRQFVSFMRYLASLWGALSTFTAFFPLVGAFRKVIPPPKLGAETCVLLATLAGLIVILLRFVNRRQPMPQMPSLRPFFFAIGATLLYVFVLPAWPSMPKIIYGNSLSTPDITSFLIDLARLFWRIVLPAFYIFIFYKFTDSFAALAVREWQINMQNRKSLLP